MTANQTSLLDAAAKADLVPANQSAPPPSYDHKPGTALADLREHAMALPAEQMAFALGEFTERRKTFRDWLLSQLIEGVHYGIPPGINIVREVRKDGVWYQDYKKNWYHESQWRPKPTLYQAGADFVVELMGLLEQFSPDEAGARMTGQKDAIVYKCTLVSRLNNQPVGEGVGARTLGAKGGDLNNSVKMACKAAKVAAVINAYGLSDLFTQDERPPKPQHEAPDQRNDAPQVKPRNERAEEQNVNGVTSKQYGTLKTEWAAQQPNDFGGDAEKLRDAFATWARKQVPEGGAMWNPNRLQDWTPDRMVRCLKALGVPA